MREYTDCYIAFIDLLGFKNYVEEHSCEDIASIFDEINEDYNITIQGLNSPWVNSEIVKKKVMSDTICFYVDSSESDSLPRLVAACAYFQVKLMRMPHSILSRGAIVKDKIYAFEDTTFGPGVGSSGHWIFNSAARLHTRETVFLETPQLVAISRSLIPRLFSRRISRYLVI